MPDESQPHLKLDLLFVLVKLVKNVNEIPFNIRRIVMRHPEGIHCTHLESGGGGVHATELWRTEFPSLLYARVFS